MEVRCQGCELAVVRLSGDWLLSAGLQPIQTLESELSRGTVPRALEFDTLNLGRWDSALLIFVLDCLQLCQRLRIEVRVTTLPAGVQQLITVSQAVPAETLAEAEVPRVTLLARLGTVALRSGASLLDASAFLGEIALAFLSLARRKAQFRWSETLVVMQECGPEALGVVALINFLVGVIIAFVAVVQLTRFGASIYVADLVAIATVREMGCLMTGIIMSGRTGAAFAAQLGTMNFNEEIDAFKTFGIPPVEFLVLPRILALLFMMPLLCIFADLISLLGGFAVSTLMLDIGSAEYLDRTLQAISLKSFLLGVFKSCVFGWIVAMTGCFRGLRSGKSAAAVGEAATSAVVSGITAIVVADGIFAVLCNALGI
jgi:phospholipid/cholesterol/gamma-HCH transport system permease protein